MNTVKKRMYCPLCGQYTLFELKEEKKYWMYDKWHLIRVWRCLRCLEIGAPPYEFAEYIPIEDEEEEKKTKKKEIKDEKVSKLISLAKERPEWFK